MSKRKVLVLLAAYNGEEWVQEQLVSILDQKDVSVTVVVRDDLSSDGTLTLIHDLASKDSRVRVLHGMRPSGSAGANFRELFAKADIQGYSYVALSDQDDVWLSDKLSSAIDMLEKSHSDGYSCAVEAFWLDGRLSVLSQSAQQSDADFLFEGAGQGCTFVMTVDFFKLVQRFCLEHAEIVKEFHYHDWLVYLLARALGKKWCFDPVPHMRYRQHGGNEIGSRGGLHATLHRLSKIRNGWYRSQVTLATEIYLLATQDELVARFRKLMLSPDSLIRRLKLLVMCVKYGRRRGGDRIVIALAVILGWL